MKLPPDTKNKKLSVVESDLMAIMRIASANPGEGLMYSLTVERIREEGLNERADTLEYIASKWQGDLPEQLVAILDEIRKGAHRS